MQTESRFFVENKKPVFCLSYGVQKDWPADSVCTARGENSLFPRPWNYDKMEKTKCQIKIGTGASRSKGGYLCRQKNGWRNMKQ